MRAVLVVDGRRHVATSAPGHAAAATFAVQCPGCKAGPPLAVRGLGIHTREHAAYVARAACVRCGAVVGSLRAEVETVFGLEEDERVLAGPWRVY